jgi:lysophospholipase L1-like esterase
VSALALMIAPVVVNGGETAAEVRAFGDSITVGYSANPQTTESYVNQVGDRKEWPISNQAVSGSQVADTAGIVYSNVIEPADVALWLCGYNDMRCVGTDTGKQSYFGDTVYALSVWLTVPDSDKITAQSSGVTYVGSWSDSAYYGGRLGKFSSTNGDTAAFVTKGSVAYIVISRTTATASGQFSVTVDGIDKGVWDCYGAPAPVSGLEYAPCLIRVAGLSSGSHSVVLTVVSSGGDAYFDWAAGNSTRGPCLYLGNCLHMNSAGYATTGLSQGDGDEAVSQFNTIIGDVAATLREDGLKVFYVDADARYVAHDASDPDTDVSSDNVHPNNTGHDHVTDAFMDSIGREGRFPTWAWIVVGIAAAMGAGILAYFVHWRLTGRRESQSTWRPRRKRPKKKAKRKHR